MNTNEYEKWIRLIGEFIVLFACVEFSVINALLQFGDEDYQKYKDMGFKKRLTKLDSIVFRMHLKKSNQKILHDRIAELKELADTRNLIAHNPTCLPLDSIFDDRPDLEIRSFLYDEDLASDNKESVITRRELETCLKQLSNAYEVLHTKLGVASFNS